MINKFIRLFVFSAYIFMVSCNDNNQTKEPIKVVTIGQIEYKVLDRSFVSNVNKMANELDTTNGFFLKVDLIVNNKSDSLIKFDTSYFKLNNDNGNVFPPSTSMEEFMRNFEPSLNLIEIPSRTEEKGFLIFNVPTMGNYKLQLSNGNWERGKEEINLAR